jgi:putative flippase GtrA
VDHSLRGRLRRLVREAASFGLIGVVNTALDFGIFYTLIFLGPLNANAISTALTTMSSYAMNRRWTYKDRPKTALRREGTLFVAFNLVGLAIQEAILGLAKYGFGLHETQHRTALLLAKCVGVAVAMVFRFWAYRTIVFKKAPALTEAPELA